MEVPIRLILHQPTPGVDFGLQAGSGTKYQTVQCQRSAGNNLEFVFELGVKGDPHKEPFPKFAGSFVQGPPGGKFIYIDIGTYAGQHDCTWSRRMKIPLAGIGWAEINKIASNQHLVLEAIVPGKGTDGTPNCATVKPFAGWQIQSRD